MHFPLKQFSERSILTIGSYLGKEREFDLIEQGEIYNCDNCLFCFLNRLEFCFFSLIGPDNI